MNTQTTVQEEIKISVSPDGMQAFLTIQPTNQYGELIDVKMVLKKLWNKGITVGIKEQLIVEMLKHRIYGKPILIAEGISPKDGQDAIIDYKFNKTNKVNLTEDIDGRVNFRELGLINIVKKGDVLATKIPPTPGVPGRKVTGEEIKANNGQDVSIPVGKNTQLSVDRNTLIAAVDGYVVWKNGIPEVETTYVIDGDVDMSTGNIYFIGDVKVKGDVKEGFTVVTEGNLDIWGGADNATIRAEGNIIVYGGIRKGQVYAEGNINCRFIENAKVEAKGNIVVRDAILHSEIISGDSVIVLEGKRGAIMGGKIKAKNEVNAKNIGSISEVPTLIEVGIDPIMREEILRLEESLKIERQELHQVKLNYDNLIAQGRTELAKSYLNKKVELENNINMMSISLNQLRKHVEATKGGKVSAFDTLWPGVKITIGMTTFEPKIDYRYISFVNNAGRIDTQGYKGPLAKVEAPIKKVDYWEREIDKIKDVNLKEL